MTAREDLAELLEQLLIEQRRRFLAGDRVPVEDLVATYPQLAQDAHGLVELIYAEFWLREQAGERPDPEEYLRGFPQVRDQLVVQFEVHQALDPELGDHGAGDKDPSLTELSSVPDRAPPLPNSALQELERRYEIHEQLGSGGMGIVYRARDKFLGRDVALKVMRPEIAAEADAKGRFLREARAAASVEHDHVVTIFDVGQTPAGMLYIAMPLLRGETLENRLQREGCLPLAEVVRIGSEIASGLAAAHSHGLIHRDIKPGNIWLEGSEVRGQRSEAAPSPDPWPLSRGGGRVKILDFGLTRLLSRSDHATSGEPSSHGSYPSLPGFVAGTPGYISPEQARGAAADARADLFSLGCVLYRMATDKAPFSGDTPWAILFAVDAKEPAPPRSMRAEIPEALERLILHLLAKDPAKRPASAADVEHILRAVSTEARRATGRPGEGREGRGQERSPPARRSYRVLAAAGVTFLLAGLVTAALLWPRPSPFGSAVAPLSGTLDVEVARPGPEGDIGKLVRFAERVPLRPGHDYVRIQATLNRQAFLYLVWVDSTGAVTLLPPSDQQREQGKERPITELFWPAREYGSKLGAGSAGIETLLMLTREEPLPAQIDLVALLKGIRVPPSGNPRAPKGKLEPSKAEHQTAFLDPAWFENGRPVRDGTDSLARAFKDRSPPRADDRLPVAEDDPVLQLHAFVYTRLQDLFPYSRAVSFATAE
jgi:serine/threonine protein kinase